MITECVNLSFIISVHGHTSELHDVQTSHKAGFARTVKGMRNLVRSQIPIQTNTVITQANYKYLVAIAKLCVEEGASHINFSALHPVGSAALSSFRIVPSFENALPRLIDAVCWLREHGVPVTVEGFPRCVAQSSGGIILEDLPRKVKMLMRGKIIENYSDFMIKTQRVHDVACIKCTVRETCGGLYPGYLQKFPNDAAVKPITASPSG
jgi:MoaA/NifB/PqqE/SkfB family radical SAM enzyme